LDQHAQFDRVVRDYIFETDVDEMDVSTILRKPIYETTFKTNTTQITGTLLLSRPISPMVEAGSVYIFSPMRKLYEASRYWRGGLKMHIQASMTNFQYCKLLVVRDYSGNGKAVLQYPKMSDVVNYMTETLEFSAGGQLNTIDLPYCAQLEQTECTKDMFVNGMTTGMVYVYLLQPLTTNGTAPTSVSFNVYFSAADDFQFYGYAVDTWLSNEVPPLSKSDTDAATLTWQEAAEQIRIKNRDNYTKLRSQPKHRPIQTRRPRAVDTLIAHGGNCNQVTVESSCQEEITNVNTDDAIKLRFDDFKPMTNIRDYVRRMVPVHLGLLPDLDSGTYVFSIASLFNIFKRFAPTIGLIEMFHGMSGGVKLKIVIKGLTTCGVTYIPPSWMYESGNFRPTIVGNESNHPWARKQLHYIDGSSAAVINPSAMTIEACDGTHADQKSNAHSISLFEFAIPNMNAFKFINVSRLAGVNSLDADMGSMVVNWSHEVTGIDNSIEVFLGLTDETRLGFQVVALPIEIPQEVDSHTGAPIRQSVFNRNTTPFGQRLDVAHVPMMYFQSIV